jgi:phage nucleotide-binding protein
MEIIKGIKPNSRFRLFIYGPPGVGKSSFANQFPGVLFADLEGGLEQIDCARTAKIKTYEEFIEACAYFKTAKEYQTLVIDTIDILEQLIWKKICTDNGVKSIEDVGGGFGKGYTLAQSMFLQLLNSLDDLGKNYIFIAHEQQKSVSEPDKPAFDKYVIKMHQKSASLITARVDAVLFSSWEIRVNAAQEKASSTGRRICITQESAACVSKNRFGLETIEEMNKNLVDKIVNFNAKKGGKQ